MTSQLFYQEQAGKFATKRDDVEKQTDILRRNGIADTVALLGNKTPGRAYAVVMRAFLEQVRTNGLAHAAIPGGEGL